jgi:SAM-dependent methyltransferase
MSASMAQVREDFDRLAALDEDQWNSNRQYEPFLLRHLPAARGAALEIGCGTGSFARVLAGHFQHVLGIDLSPEMLRRARARSRDVGNLEFREADICAWALPPDAFDCIAAVATLHHVPLEPVLEGAKRSLRPGGVLLVLDLFQWSSWSDRALSTVALLAYPAMRVWKVGSLRDSGRARRAWAEHGRRDRYSTLPALRAICERMLPGATLRRHLFWRYSLVWRKPAGC